MIPYCIDRKRGDLMLNGKPLIAVVATRVSEREQRIMLDGIMKRADSLGYYTAVISNIYNFTDFSEYFGHIEVENKIYELAESDRIDGVILMAESIIGTQMYQFIYNKIIKNKAPIIITGAELEGHICINNDVREDFRNIAHHLTDVHGFTDIHVLTGQKHIETSLERVEGVRDALLEKGIVLPDENVIYGNFWMSSGEAAAMEYIEGKRRLPQAIICANDYMAYGLIDTFFAHNINLPDDVTVIGYEYSGERFYHSPILTTYLRNRSAIGERAVSELHRILTGKKPEEIPLGGCMICGDTCSCGIDKKYLREELEEVRREQFHNSMTICGNFEQQLALCRSLKDYIRALQDYTYLIRNLKGLYLCLYENWCNLKEVSQLDISSNDKMMTLYRIISPIETASEPHFFKRSRLFTDELYGAGERLFLYFVPMFTDGIELGYFIFQYTEPDGYDPVTTGWVNAAVNALNVLRMKNDINELLEYNNLSVFHDTMTGLYNKQGLQRELETSLSKAEKGDMLSVVMLKSGIFADNSRIDEKEQQVRLNLETADCLKKISADGSAICARLPDGQYVYAVMGKISEDHDKLIIDRLTALIIHSPVFKTFRKSDMIVHGGVTVPAAEASPERIMKKLSEEINDMTAELYDKRKSGSYGSYIDLRTAVYAAPEKKWEAEEVCREFHLSCGHFRAAYKKTFGISFHRDLIQSRISLAKYLLLTSALNLTAIAQRCGYDDDKYFLRQFRQQTGVSPNSYRRFESGAFSVKLT